MKYLAGLWSLVVLAVFAVMTLLARDYDRTNCFIWAYHQWNRDGREGAVLIVKSKHGWWPHVRYMTPSGVIQEFVPHRAPWRFRTRSRWLRSVPPIIFRGRVR